MTARISSSAAPISAAASADRAAERVTMELGPRNEREIQSALEREVEAERWTSLDRALRNIADEGAWNCRHPSWCAGFGS